MSATLAKAANRHIRLAQLFGVSFCLLAFEICLLRILSYVQWYHFAYLIISLALLGFAVSGSLMHLFRDFWLRHAGIVSLALILLTALAMALGRQALAWIPVDIFTAIWKPSELVWLALLCLVLFLPFLFGAFFIILSFSAAPRRIGGLYGANLLGSGVGSLGAILFLHLWHPLSIPFVTSFMCALVALPSAMQRRSHLVLVIGGLTIIGLCWQMPAAVNMSQYKALSRVLLMPDTTVTARAFDPYGVYELVSSPHLRSAAGLSLGFDGAVQPRPTVFADGATMGALTLADHADHARWRQTVFNLPYRVRDTDTVLVLDAGVGEEIRRALLEGAASVTAVEKSRALLHMLGQQPASEQNVYDNPAVEAVEDEPRSFLAARGGTYDLIILPPGRSLASASLGMQSLYEDYLLTTESFELLIDSLNDDGIVSISSVLDTPLRRPIKLFALMAESLRQSDVRTPGKHLIAIRNWNMVTFVMSRKPFSVTELERARAFATQSGLDMIFPFVAEAARHHLAENDLPAMLAGLAATPPVHPDSPFHLVPPTDNQPYFGHFLTTAAASHMMRTFGAAGLILQEWAYAIAGFTILLLMLSGLALVLLPLRMCRLTDSPARHLAYFAAIGCGFMFVEMLMIQKLTLILGDPVYAVSAVVAALLIFAGIGSVLSSSIKWPAIRTVSWSTALLLILVLLFFISHPLLATTLAAWPSSLRFAGVVLLVAFPAVVMGLYFPLGIRALERSGQLPLIPWAWGVNGFVSVISAPLAMLTAVGFGFAAVGVIGIGFYALAVGTARFMSPSGHT